jgi:two-component system response regulator NreC
MILRLLLVDDHHLMLEGYKSILEINKQHEVVIETATNCEIAYKILKTSKVEFDVVLLDIVLPAYQEERIFDGRDLAPYIAKTFPKCKIVFLTSHSEIIVLYEIIKKFQPIGLLVKSDFTSKELLIAFECILNGEKYFSKTVHYALKQITGKEIYLDIFNRQIILLLAQGIQTKNLINYLPLSMSAIDKRKAFIKEYFQIEKGNDEDVLRAAKKAGLI